MKRRDFLRVLGVLSAGVLAPVSTEAVQLYPKNGALPHDVGDIWLPARLSYQDEHMYYHHIEMMIPVTAEMQEHGVVFNSKYDFAIEAEQDMFLIAFEIDIAPAVRVVHDVEDIEPQWGRLYGTTKSIAKGSTLFIRYNNPIISCEV